MGRLFFIMCMAFSGLLAAAENSFISDILTYQPDSVLFLSDSKLYLRSEKIHATPGGIVIGDQQSYIPVPFLFSDEMGCYLPTASRAVVSYWMCYNPHCENYKKIWRGKSPNCPKCGEEGDAA